jgi:hypothetical protein
MHPCLEWDPNPRPQCSRERRQNYTTKLNESSNWNVTFRSLLKHVSTSRNNLCFCSSLCYGVQPDVRREHTGNTRNTTSIQLLIRHHSRVVTIAQSAIRVENIKINVSIHYRLERTVITPAVCPYSVHSIGFVKFSK